LSSVFSEDTDGTVTGPTAAEITANKILRADNTWITNPLAGFSGTEGSVIFVDANGNLTEDNSKLFFDNSSDELGINAGTTPEATLHLARDISTGKIFRAVRSGTAATEEVFFVGASGSTADLIVTGDGRVGMNVSESVLNAQCRIASTHSTACLILDQNGTTSAVALLIDHEGTVGDAIDVSASCTTGIGLDLACDALTTGKVAYLRSSSSSNSNRVLVDIVSSNVAATGTVPLKVSHNAAGVIAQFMYGLSGTDVAFEVDTTGHLKMRCDQTTDVAPNDDTTTKKMSLQRLTAPPTNAMYLALQNTPDTTGYYLVFEEG